MTTELDPFLSPKVLRIFLEEARRGVFAAQTALNRLGELSNPERSELAMVFHRLKGGAGFFGLNDVATAAAELEQTFSASPSSPVEAQTVSSALNRIEVQIDSMSLSPAARKEPGE